MAGIHIPGYMQKRSAHTVGMVFLASLLLAACSSSDSNPPPNDGPTVDPDNDDRPGLAIEGLNGTPADQLTSPWLANMSFFRVDSLTPGTGDAFIELLQYDENFQVSNHLDFYAPELDTCEIRDLNGDGGISGGGNEPDMVSGGKSLTINTPSGTWFDLGMTESSVGVYETDNALPGAFPDDLTLSIPGDVFPSVAAYPLVEPVPPVRILPTANVLTLDDVTTPFTWIPGVVVPGGYVELTGLAFDVSDEFIGFPILCEVVDDGSFTMPQNVIDAFAAMPADETIRVRFERSISRVDFIDGIVFHQRSTVSE